MSTQLDLALTERLWRYVEDSPCLCVYTGPRHDLLNKRCERCRLLYERDCHLAANRARFAAVNVPPHPAESAGAQGVDPEHHDAEVEASEPETSGAGDAAAAEAVPSADDTSAPEEPGA